MSWNVIWKRSRCTRYTVTPSRVCELKLNNMVFNIFSRRSHPHGCVSWNLVIFINASCFIMSHPHGCVSWNLNWLVDKLPTLNVTPSRVCELKSVDCLELIIAQEVTPSRVCELKWLFNHKMVSLFRHTLTGVWVEISVNVHSMMTEPSHPHGCVSWNWSSGTMLSSQKQSHPHGCVSWNYSCRGMPNGCY